MENTALLLIVVTNMFLVLIVGVLVFFVYKMIRLNQTKVEDPLLAKLHPDALARITELKKLKPRVSYVCSNHPDEPSENTCAVCNRGFCIACVKPFKAMHVCHEHYELVMNTNWEEILTVKSSAKDPERGVKLYEVKKELFTKEDIPTFIETHYKINVDHDFIETYLVLYAQPEQSEALKLKFKDFITA